MKREFLEGLRVGEQALTEEVIDAILQESGQELAQVQLKGAVETAIAKAGGRSSAAICALLDLDAIGASDNAPAALDAALSKLKKESGYLFESPTPPPYARFTGAAQGSGGQVPQTLAGALRERMEK